MIRTLYLAWFLSLVLSVKSVAAEQYEGNSNPWVTEASGHQRNGHGLNWDVSVFKGNGISDIFPKQIESDPSSGTFYVTGSWRGEIDLGGHTMTSVKCVNSQECSFFVMKMRTTGDETEVIWARTLVQPERNASVLSQNSMDVGPDGSVVIDGQYCLDNIVVGDGKEQQILTLDKETDHCLGFIAKFDSAGALQWAKKFGVGNRKMSEGQLRVHSKTGDIFISGLFMGEDVRYGDRLASSRRRDVDGQPPAGLFYDAGDAWSHHYSIWVAKVAGGDGETLWLQTLNTSNTQVTMPNMVLDDSSDNLYLSLSTHDPPFYLHTSSDGVLALADGFVVQMDTDGKISPDPFRVEAVQETAGQEGEPRRNDPMGQFSYLKYMTSVAAADGSLFVSGVFYGTVNVQGRVIRSKSTRHEASFVARLSPDRLELEWLELMEATDNLSVQHMEMADSSLYVVGWLVGEVNFGNGVALSTAKEGGRKRSESFVLEMSQSSGRVSWAEKGSAEEFFDASLIPNGADGGQSALVILGGFYWTAQLDTSGEDAIISPWDLGEESDLSGMVILSAALDASNISPVLTSEHNAIWFGPASTSADTTTLEGTHARLPTEKQAIDERLAGPYDSGATGAVDFSPAAREAAEREGTKSKEGGTEEDGALSVLSIAMIALAVLVGLLALAGVLCVVTVCFRKRSLSSMYTHWRHTTDSVPGHSRNPSSGSSFFGTGHSRNPSIASTQHSRTPSDVVANLALVRMTHLPPHTFEPSSTGTRTAGADPVNLTSALEQLDQKPGNSSAEVGAETVTVDIAPPN